MLSYFPQVRDEEPTYSIFARMQFALQPPNYEIMGKMLFNKASEVGRLNFQGSFDYLCNNLPSKFTPEKFFYNNTIYPLFIPFISREKQEKALEYFKGNYPGKLVKFLTMSNGNKNRSYIRVCKECIKEDFNIYGEPYYRRQHEIELNRMCYKHKLPLYEYSIPNYRTPRRYDDYYTVLSNSKEINIPKEFKEKLMSITDNINSIFTSNFENWTVTITKDKIYNKLKERGYFTASGTKLQMKLNQDFKQYYTEEFLDYIGDNFDVQSNSSWFSMITRNRVLGNPLRYILIIQFLFGSFKEFYHYNKEYSTFKKGPYPCLNVICPNYNKLLIKDFSVNISHRNPVATFKCEHCGFKYSRRGPDMNDNDIYKKTYVKDHGHLWHSKLEECIDNGLSITKIAKILGCNSYSVVHDWTKRYKNSNSVEVSIPEENNELHNSLLNQYKNIFLNFLEENPDANRLNLFKFNGTAYRYLLLNDKEWILNIEKPIEKSKSIEKRKPIPKEDKIKNYWLNQDELLSVELLKAIDNIKSEKILYRRLTVYTLQKYIGCHNLNRNRHRLPRCSQILDDVCETIFDYQKRRVNYVVQELAYNNVMVTVNKVLRKANLEFGPNINKELLNYVKEKVKEYGRGDI